ncbi:MAG: hypothetical protein AAFY41_15545 [Bacteroidota bacterium]
MNHIQSHEALMREYVSNSESSHARFMMVKGAENLRDQKFIELGYNPFAFTDEFYMNQFRDDPDIKALNEKSEFIRF